MADQGFSKSNLQNFDAAQFMRHYWQRKPLFVKNALAAGFTDLSPQDLFKLARRDEVESRLVARKNVRGHWRYAASEGPFTHEQIVAQRNKRDWTLLVQRVNEWLPRVDLLFEYFKFIAAWRVDDIMVSYAAPGGTVGAHLDNYDVFLCQLKGSRTWQYSRKAFKDENLEANQPVRLLTDFKADAEVTARPGDILYIPPRFAHYGIANDECITVSVGFRAPQISQLMGIFFQELSAQWSEKFYSDKGAPVTENPGEFGEQALQRLFTQTKTAVQSGGDRLRTGTFADALLRDLSATPNAQIDSRAKLTPAQFKTRWRKQPLQRNPRNQYFYRQGTGSVSLYAAGESLEIPKALGSTVADFCNARIFPCTAACLRPRPLAFWYEMFSLGFVFFPK